MCCLSDRADILLKPPSSTTFHVSQLYNHLPCGSKADQLSTATRSIFVFIIPYLITENSLWPTPIPLETILDTIFSAILYAQRQGRAAFAALVLSAACPRDFPVDEKCHARLERGKECNALPIPSLTVISDIPAADLNFLWDLHLAVWLP